jgi:uncharacterized protein
MEEIPWLVILIIFVASTVFSTFGFGDALLAMPFLSIMLGAKTATPLLALCGLTLAIALMGAGYRHIQYREAFKLILGSLLGVPIGVVILKYGDDQNIRMAIGIIIALVAIYNLFRPRMAPLAKDTLAPIFGFAGGVLGGAFNTSGPPAVIYGAMRQWQPMVFVGMMQAYFIPTDIFVIIGHLKSGLLNGQVLQLFLWCLPALLLAVYVGHHIKKRMAPHRFHRAIFVIILVSGLLLFGRSLAG